MKRLVIEQDILKLPNDNKWEYAVINGVWNARKIGSSNWINIETNPKIKSQIAINLLNKSFPNAKSKSLLGEKNKPTLFESVADFSNAFLVALLVGDRFATNSCDSNLTLFV